MAPPERRQLDAVLDEYLHRARDTALAVGGDGEDLALREVRCAPAEPDPRAAQRRAQLAAEAARRRVPEPVPLANAVRISLDGQDFDLTLDDAEILELLETAYLTSGSKGVASFTDAINARLIALNPYGGSEDMFPPEWREEFRRLRDAGRRIARAGAALAPAIDAAVAEVRALAEEETRLRISRSLGILLDEMVGYAPACNVAQLRADHAAGTLRPAAVAAFIEDGGWTPDPSAPHFVLLRQALAELDHARGQIAVARTVDAADLAARVAQAVYALLAVVELDPAERADAEQLLALVKEVGERFGSAQSTAGPLPLAAAPQALVEALGRYGDARIAATNAYCAARAATVRTFPLLRRLDVEDHNGKAAGDTELVEALVEAALTAARRQQSVEESVEDDPGVVFGYTVALRASLARAGIQPGTMAYAAAADRLDERTLHPGILGDASLVVEGVGLITKAPVPLVQLGTALVESLDAISAAAQFSDVRDAYEAALDPAVELVTAEPSALDLTLEVLEAVLEWSLLVLALVAVP
jgi:hypothetical protein